MESGWNRYVIEFFHDENVAPIDIQQCSEGSERPISRC